MTMMHLTYPRRKGFFYWEELGCLARALGFPLDMFLSNISEEALYAEPGVTVKEFNKMIEYKYFHESVERTFNMHSAEWNLCCVRQAIRLLQYKVLSFEQLQNVRVAYQVYESGDMKGMIINQHILLRALKMCGRTISPLKLMHRIKHMSEDFEEQGRIQLYEFLDLILWCDTLDTLQLEPVALVSGEDDDGTFKLNEFEDIMKHYDERLSNYLDSTYLKEEWDFGLENIKVDKKISKEPPVDNQKRLKQVKYHKQKYRPLKLEVAEAQNRVHYAKAGYVRPRPISAPDIASLDQRSQSERNTVPDTRPQTVMEMAEHILRPQTRHEHRDIREEIPRPNVTRYFRPPSPTAVTSADVKQTNYNVDSLKFEMETLELKYNQMLNNDLDYLMPGYREKKENMEEPEPSRSPTPPNVKKQKQPSSKFIDRMAYSEYRPIPPPSHAKACDARFRGWHKVKTKRGHHVIVASQTFQNSPQRRLFQKLTHLAARELQHIHGDKIKRYTSLSNVKHEILRPNTAPSDVLLNQKEKPFDLNEVASAKLSQLGSNQTLDMSGRDSGSHRPQSAASSKSVISWSDLKVYAEDPEVVEEKKKATSKHKKRSSLLSQDQIDMGKSDKCGENKPKIEVTKTGPVALLENILESDDLEYHVHSDTKAVKMAKSKQNANITTKKIKLLKREKSPSPLMKTELRYHDRLDSDGDSIVESSDDKRSLDRSYRNFFDLSIDKKGNQRRDAATHTKKTLRLMKRVDGVLSEELTEMMTAKVPDIGVG